MTNKLFIVKYVFVVDINDNVDIDKNNTLLTNLNINLDKRKNFDDMINLCSKYLLF